MLADGQIWSVNVIRKCSWQHCSSTLLFCNVAAHAQRPAASSVQAHVFAPPAASSECVCVCLLWGGCPLGIGQGSAASHMHNLTWHMEDVGGAARRPDQESFGLSCRHGGAGVRIDHCGECRSLRGRRDRLASLKTGILAHIHGGDINVRPNPSPRVLCRTMLLRRGVPTEAGTPRLSHRFVLRQRCPQNGMRRRTWPLPSSRPFLLSCSNTRRFNSDRDDQAELGHVV